LRRYIIIIIIIIKKCTYLSDTVTLNVGGALYTVKGIINGKQYSRLKNHWLTKPEWYRNNPTKSCDGTQMAIFGDFSASCIFSELRAAHFRPAF